MKQWTVQTPDEKTISEIVKQCGVTSLTASVLASKGYSSPEEVMEKLEVRELSDPFLIKDMKEATDVINAAIDDGERICIYGDYDCDGIMATVIIFSYLSEVGADVMYYIPERSEGYGLNNNAIDEIAASGAKIILTVDNGISAVNEAEYIYSLGMKLIVTDHHQEGDTLPRAEAVVDPHRHDCESPFKYMCGAGIALKLVAALNDGDYTIAMEQFADLAAIATVADIVSLTGENRFLVSQGMKLIDNTDKPALIAMKEVCKMEKSVDTSAIGFRIAPRINAAGRFGSPKQAAKLLLCEDYDEAIEIAKELDALNTERKNTENSIIKEIYGMIDENPDIIRGRIIFICGKEWHHGVIGIVASRIEEHFGKPCFIVSENDGEIRGSARAFGNFSVFEALTYTAETLEKFGGHMGAGGFTIKHGMKDDFHALLEKYALEKHRQMPFHTVQADAVLSADMINIRSVENLKLLEPFGCENENPCFLIKNSRIREINPLSDGKHSKLSIEIDGHRATALAFFKSPSELMVKSGDICNMIVRLSINEFNGKRDVQISIQDIRPATIVQKKYLVAQRAFEFFLRGEELPEEYYKAMLPVRDDAVRIYRSIPDSGISSDLLYSQLCRYMNYCKFSAAVEAFRQLGIISISSADSVIKKTVTDSKSDFNSAPVIIALKEKIS